MTKRVDTCLEIKPIPKGRPKFVVRGRFATAYTPKQTRDYENKVKVFFKNLVMGKVKPHKVSEQYALNCPIAEPCWVVLNIFIEKPKSVKRKYPTTKPDIDNYVKAIFDSANNILWKDDSQVVSLIVRKNYSSLITQGFILEIWDTPKN